MAWEHNNIWSSRRQIGDRSIAKRTGDQSRCWTLAIIVLFFTLSCVWLSVSCNYVFFLTQTLTSVQLNHLTVTSMPNVWTCQALLTVLVKPVSPEMEQLAKVCEIKQCRSMFLTNNIPPCLYIGLCIKFFRQICDRKSGSYFILTWEAIISLNYVFLWSLLT